MLELVSLRPVVSIVPDRDEINDPSSALPHCGTVLKGQHIGVVVFSYYPSDPRVRRETEALKAEGASIDLFCLQGDDQKSFEVVNGVSVYRLPLERKRGGKFRYLYQYAVFLLLSFLKLTVHSLRARYTLVHVHNMPDFLVFAAIVPKLMGAKIVLDLHDPTPEVYKTIYNLGPKSAAVKILHWIEKLSIGFSNLAITPNIAFKELFVQRGCAPEKILIIMNSPQTEIFERARQNPLPKNHDEFRLMFHGSLLERHGLTDLINAIHSLRPSFPSLRLDIYGERTCYVDQIEKQIAALHLGGIVQYHGPKPLEEIARLVQAADLGVIPNKRSCFTEINMPTRIFEYLEMHTPVIAPRTKGVMDYFDESEMLYFEPGDARDLAERIRWVCTHPVEVAERVLTARSIYLAHQWSKEKAKLVSRCSELLSA